MDLLLCFDLIFNSFKVLSCIPESSFCSDNGFFSWMQGRNITNMERMQERRNKMGISCIQSL